MILTWQQIALILLTILVALAIGLLLRGVLVRRLKRTVLDNWLVQTLGVIVIVLLLILAVPVVSFTLTGNLESLALVIWLIVAGNPQISAYTSIIRNFLAGILIIVLGIGVARTLQKATIRGLGEQQIDINIRILLGRIFYATILIFAVFWALSAWQVSIGVPVAVVGALTVAFAFAIQDILKDLVAGMYILVERPFHIGDQITISTYTGVVEEVQLRATKLRLLSGEELSIPNSLVFGGIVVNNTYYGERRATISVTLPQDDFVKDETPEKILDVIKGLDTVMAKPEPLITISSFAGAVSGYTGTATGYTSKTVLLTVRFWIASKQISAVTDVMYALRNALPDADLAVRESAGDI